MAQISYRANLSAATFPLTVGEGGRTVIVPGPDNNFDRRVDPTGEQKNAGIPQVLYMENVIPTSNGYQSVGYSQFTTPMVTLGNPIVKVSKVFASLLDNNYINFIYETSTGLKKAGTTGAEPVLTGAWSNTDRVTSCTVRGVAYIYAGYKLYTSAGSTGDLTVVDVTATVTPSGFLTTNNIRSILSFANYLIAVSGTGEIFWSSTTNPLDFVASLVSGAGNIIPLGLRGIYIETGSAADGWYIYTTETAIFVEYTGNARYPFRFSTVKGFSGISGSAYTAGVPRVAGGDNFSGNIVIDSYGKVRFIQKTAITDLFPEISDYLERVVYQEVFDSTTNTFTTTPVSTASPSITLWQDRFVILSINDSSDTTVQYTHALIYDSLLQRLGKLKIKHKFVVTFNASKGAPGLGFIDAVAGTISYLNMDIYGSPINFMTVVPHDAVLILGKFQYVRSRMMQLLEIEAEGAQNTDVISSPNFSCIVLPSLDGRNFDPAVIPSSEVLMGELATYRLRHTAKNHSIVFKGAFSLSSVQLTFVPSSGR